MKPQSISALVVRILAGHDLAISFLKSTSFEILYVGWFFFKNSTKVPHLLDVDWEVVVKHREMNVVVKPNVAYGLLSLLLQSPENSGWGVQKRRNTVTVALDEQLIAKLITSLVNLKEALQKTSKELEETGAKE